MIRIREVIVVEGKYDTIRLRSLVEATVIETSGFGIFKDPEQQEMLRRLAAARGLLVLTDSDGAGFVIRDFLSGMLPADQIKHAYIPDISGKERRKTAPSQEGLLGVEGMQNEVVLEALRRAGATFETDPPAATDAAPASAGCALTKADLYADGLIGTAMSAARRRLLQKQLKLPEKLSANRLLQVLNIAVTPTEYADALAATNAAIPADTPSPEKR